MAASLEVSRFAPPNRRRRVRHKVHAPAYATFSAASQGEMLDLYEVLDISEAGLAIQCSSALQRNQLIDLCLDLAEERGQICVSARVVWSDHTGRTGFSFPNLSDASVRRLREWLFLNAIAAASNAAAVGALPAKPAEDAFSRPNYTDMLTAASAVQREAQSLGPDLVAILSLIASRSQSLLRASGAAIALIAEEPETMICRASSGDSAPPLGAALQVGSGFSGECVRTATMLRCQDTETDERVDRPSCQALGVRSILAAPILAGEKAIGLIEVFSAAPGAFSEDDGRVLERFAETILAAVRHAIATSTVSSPPPAPAFSPHGSVLFASEAEGKNQGAKENRAEEVSNDHDSFGGIRLPRAHLVLLMAAAATIALALGFILAPWIQEKLQERDRNGEHTVLASSPAPAAMTPPLPTVDTAGPQQLQELADRGDPAAENALGLLYAEGDAKRGVKPNEAEAARWFSKAADHNYVPAQSKLGSLYWGGRGVPASLNQAYFWTVLARAGGDPGSKTLAPVLASHMTRAQAAAIEQQAEIWYQQHEASSKPLAGR